MIKYSILLFLLASLSGCCNNPESTEDIRVGQMVEQVSYAIKHPDSESAFETITQAGTDSRHYVMIRGWLMQELSGVQSQLNATRDDTKKAAFQARVDFLQRVVRRIDLE